MNVYILADLEGVGGVHEFDDWHRDDAGHQARRARLAELMVGEVNAAVEGALAGGATAVVVRDDHTNSDTIPPDKLDPRARLSRGPGRDHPLPLLGPEFSALVMIGQHARAGNPRGNLSHTYSRRIHSVRINHVETGEIGINAGLAGELGVPTCFVSGDTEAVNEARSLLDGLVAVETKVSQSMFCAEARPAASVRAEIAAGVEQSLKQVGHLRPYLFPPPVELAVRYHSWVVNVARYFLRRQWSAGRLSGSHTVVYRGCALTPVWRQFIAG